MKDELSRFDRCSLDSNGTKRFDDLFRQIESDANHFLGYPCSQEFDYTCLYPFLSYPINNVGDPYTPSNYRMNSHEFEREVISFFAELTESGQEDVWGYVTNGGTEGNLYGIYLAREIYPDGMVYFSEDTHYSVSKILRILHARSIMIKSHHDGEFDYRDLAETISIHRDVPAIIFANIGTTMKGAMDNLTKIKNILKERAITQYYIHADAALGGMILPFVDQAQPYSFAAGIDSISISGHKMIGSPIPCGVVLARKKHVARIARAVEYVGTLDTTITGSRNGITPLFLWYAINTKGKSGFRRIIENCIENSDYAVARFKEEGIDAWRHRNSITVVFPKVAESVLKKWQIATQDDIAHIIVMPQVGKKQIDRFIVDVVSAMGLNTVAAKDQTSQ